MRTFIQINLHNTTLKYGKDNIIYDIYFKIMSKKFSILK